MQSVPLPQGHHTATAQIVTVTLHKNTKKNRTSHLTAGTWRKQVEINFSNSKFYGILFHRNSSIHVLWGKANLNVNCESSLVGQSFKHMKKTRGFRVLDHPCHRHFWGKKLSHLSTRGSPSCWGGQPQEFCWVVWRVRRAPRLIQAILSDGRRRHCMKKCSSSSSASVQDYPKRG